MGPFDYHVSIHRFDRFEEFLVYPIRLEERLPELAIPLLPGDPDVPLDLQAAFDHAYETGPYRAASVTPRPPPFPRFAPIRANGRSSGLQAAGLGTT